MSSISEKLHLPISEDYAAIKVRGESLGSFSPSLSPPGSVGNPIPCFAKGKILNSYSKLQHYNFSPDSNGCPKERLGLALD